MHFMWFVRIIPQHSFNDYVQVSWIEPVLDIGIKCLAPMHNHNYEDKLGFKPTTFRSEVPHSTVTNSYLWKLCQCYNAEKLFVWQLKSKRSKWHITSSITRVCCTDCWHSSPLGWNFYRFLSFFGVSIFRKDNSCL